MKIQSFKSVRAGVLLSFLIVRPAFAGPPDGYVVRVDSAMVYLDWGKSSKIQTGEHFQLYRPGEILKHPVSGEILGHTEMILADGSIQSVEEKFAIGRLEGSRQAARVGDRSRWLSAAAVAIPATTPTAIPATSLLGVLEIWRSTTFDNESPAAVTFCDLDRDGQKEVVIAFKDQIQALRFKDKRLEPLASFNCKKWGRCLALDAADVKGDGQELLFATAFPSGSDRPKALVLQYENGELKKVGEFEGFVRSYLRADGKKVLLRQTTGPSVDLTYTGVSQVEFTPKGYKPGKALDLKMSKDQALGFAWGSWLGSGQENFATLDRGEWLRIYGGETRWKSNDTYGGTKNDFPYGRNALGSVSPRLLTYRSLQENKDLLLVPKNFPELGIRFTYMKIFRRSEIAALTWNGTDMVPLWKIPIEGYLADMVLENAMNEPQPQLWALSVGAGKKTVLVAYRLP